MLYGCEKLGFARESGLSLLSILLLKTCPIFRIVFPNFLITPPFSITGHSAISALYSPNTLGLWLSDWTRHGLPRFPGFNADGRACFMRDVTARVRRGLRLQSYTGCYGYDSFVRLDIMEKQMKILGRPTCGSITRWQQAARRYFSVVRSQCTIGGIRAWFVRKVAPVVGLVRVSLWPHF